MNFQPKIHAQAYSHPLINGLQNAMKDNLRLMEILSNSPFIVAVKSKFDSTFTPGRFATVSERGRLLPRGRT